MNSSRFLNSTFLVGIPRTSKRYASSQKKRPKGPSARGMRAKGFGTAVTFSLRVQGPPISKALLNNIQANEPEFITRHFEERFLESYRAGYFRFGTLSQYRATEEESSGRLGDHQEGRVQDEIYRKDGKFQKAYVNGADFSGATFEDCDKQIVTELTANDYCSCSSTGVFRSARAKVLRDAEVDPKKKPGAFITYNLKRLRQALEKHFLDDPALPAFGLVGRHVQYGEKDGVWEMPKSFEFQRGDDSFVLWLEIAFLKSQRYAHEEEYRLLLADLSGPGTLDDQTERIIIENNKDIAAAIVASGTYWSGD